MKPRSDLAIAITLSLMLSAGGAGAAPVITLNTSTGLPDGDPIVIRGGTADVKGLTMDRATGTLYEGRDANGFKFVYKIDSAVTKLKSVPNAASNDASMGNIRNYSTGFGYNQGSVKLGTLALGYANVYPSWNPNTGTLMLKTGTSSNSSGTAGYIGVDEIIPQTAAEATGALNEGESTAQGGPNTTSAAIVSEAKARQRTATATRRAGLPTLTTPPSAARTTTACSSPIRSPTPTTWLGTSCLGSCPTPSAGGTPPPSVRER
ncbi:MAG: hypothetical protein BIFFINMI_03591 [Phycisphaerae bacterium]|nr:hypothetical protein [Phycisphaerae bacterium]